MKKFEYKTVRYDAKGFFGGKVDPQEFDASLNSYGAEGWELVGITASNEAYGSTKSVLSIFKREVE